jgi:ABC-type polysaccharide/polyol phosphate transport system ATPase subunit
VSRKYAMRDILTPSGMRRADPRPQEASALSDLSFDLAAGQTLLVLGFEGLGKTTLARLTCGLTRPTIGTVSVEGTTRLVSNQRLGPTPVMRLREYTRLLCMMLGADSRSLTDTVETILDDCHLAEWKDVRVHNAPEGAVKRVGFYASILIDADVYVFDHVMTLRGESSELRELFDTRVAEILATRTAVLLMKRVPVEVAPDRVLVLHRGQSIFQGDPDLAIAAYDRLAQRVINAEDTRKDEEMDRGVEFMASVRPDTDDEAKRVAWDFDVSLEATKRLQEIADSDNPILVGPYLGGFDAELLLWIPFLRWVMRSFEIPQERVTCMSRGGADGWYEGIGARYIDAFELTGEVAYHQRFRDRVAKGGLRQSGVEPLDEIFYRRGIRTLGLTRNDGAEWLHPSLFFKLAMAVWKGTVERSFLTDKLSMERFAEQPDARGSAERPYIAVWFGPTPYLLRTEAAPIVPPVLAELAREAVLIDVVTGKELEPPFEAVLPPEDTSPEEQGHCADREALQRSTRIIAGARGFLSAHGGLSYLGPLQGVPTVTVYSDPANYRPVPVGWTAVNFGLSTFMVERLTGSVPMALDAARVSETELLGAVRGRMS